MKPHPIIRITSFEIAINFFPNDYLSGVARLDIVIARTEIGSFFKHDSFSRCFKDLPPANIPDLKSISKSNFLSFPALPEDTFPQ